MIKKFTKKICTQVFTAALSIIAPKWNQPTCAWAGDWVHKLARLCDGRLLGDRREWAVGAYSTAASQRRWDSVYVTLWKRRDNRTGERWWFPGLEAGEAWPQPGSTWEGVWRWSRSASWVWRSLGGPVPVLKLLKVYTKGKVHFSAF